MSAKLTVTDSLKMNATTKTSVLTSLVERKKRKDVRINIFHPEFVVSKGLKCM